MKNQPATTRAALSLLPLGEGPGMRVLRLDEGAQHTRDLEQTIAGNVAEILEA